MEFREYWQIIVRRRNVIVPLVAITFIASLIFNMVLPPAYKTDTTVYVQAVIPMPAPGTPEYYSWEYYRTIYSEYLSDDLSVIVRSRDFADKIADRIGARFGQKVDGKDIQDAITKTKREHRTLKITVSTGSEARTRQIADAMDDVLRSDAWKYFTRDDRQPIVVNPVDPPRDPTAPSLLRRLLEVLLQTSVAGVVGVGLAFLLHYLDDRVQDEDDAARTLGWPVLGAIPTGGTTLQPDGLIPRGWIPLSRTNRNGRVNGRVNRTPPNGAASRAEDEVTTTAGRH